MAEKYFVADTGFSWEESLAYFLSPIQPGQYWVGAAFVDRPTVILSKNGTPEKDVYIEAIESDGAHISRLVTDGASLYLDEGCITGSIRGAGLTIDYAMNLLLDVLAYLGVKGERHKNDILIDGKKIFGVGRVFPNGYFALGVVGNIFTPPSTFAKYIKPAEDKLGQYGEGYVGARVGRLADYIPGLTHEAFFNAYKEVYKPDIIYSKKDIEQMPGYQKIMQEVSSPAWVEYGLMPSEVYRVQEIIFNNGTKISVEEVQGNTVSGREVLTFIIPEQEAASFETLKNIFTDEDATKSITITYYDQTGEGKELRKNLQNGFVVPVSLSYENGKYLMALGKQTAGEAELYNMKERLLKLERLAAQD